MPLAPLSTLSSLGADLGQAAVETVTGTDSSGKPSILPGWATRVLIIVLGLLLIAAGIFSFDKVKTTIVEAGEAAATAA